MAYDANAPVMMPIGPDLPVILAWPPVDAVPDPSFRVLGYNIYRGRCGVVGLVGTVIPGMAYPWKNGSEWIATRTYKQNAVIGNSGRFWISTRDANTGNALPTGAAPACGKWWRELIWDPDHAFVDYGDAPDYTKQPPLGRNPFQLLNADGTPNGAPENPALVTYYQQRRIFGNTATRPASLIASRVGDYTGFDKGYVHQDDEQFELELAAQRFEEIRGLAPGRRLLALTSGAAWAVSGAQGGALSASSIDASVQAHTGGAWPDPLLIDNEAIYLKDLAPHVLSTVFEFETQTYSATELQLLADHLFQGHTVVDWCWAHDPFHCIWIVREDGVLLSCTYLKEQEIIGWAHHDTDGYVEAICTVPETGQDAVYLVVRRTINGNLKRYVERMSPDGGIVQSLSGGGGYISQGQSGTPSRLGDARFAALLDCALSADGHNLNSALTLVVQDTGGGLGVGATVRVVTSPGVDFFNAAWVGTRMVFYPDATQVRITVTSVTSYGGHNVLLGTALDAIPGALVSTPSADWARAISTLANLTQLANKPVMALLDGVAFWNLTVSGGGALTLPGPAIVMCIGLPYTSELELLEPIHSQAEVRLLLKNLKRISFEAEASGLFLAGQDLTHLQAFTAPALAPGAWAPSELLAELRTAANWTKSGLGAVRQSLPYPTRILSVIRELEFGGA
jgi:hypothetical protein